MELLSGPQHAYPFAPGAASRVDDCALKCVVGVVY